RSAFLMSGRSSLVAPDLVSTYVIRAGRVRSVGTPAASRIRYASASRGGDVWLASRPKLGVSVSSGASPQCVPILKSCIPVNGGGAGAAAGSLILSLGKVHSVSRRLV